MSSVQNQTGSLNFSPAMLDVGKVADSSISTGIPNSGIITAPSGDIQIGGQILTIDPKLTAADQLLSAQIAGFSKPEEKISVNDMMSELTMMMLQNAFATKSIEREMKAELATVQFDNGMKMADMIEKKGELAYKSAVTRAVTQLVSAVAAIGAQKIGEKLATPKPDRKTTADISEVSTEHSQVAAAEARKQAAQNVGMLARDMAKAVVDMTGGLIAADLDLGISQLDAEQKKMETMSRLIDSVSSSVDSSIRSADSAVQFAMNMLQQINSLAYEGCNRIISNMR